MIFSKIVKVYPRYIPAKFESRSSHSVRKRSNVKSFQTQASKTELLPLFFDRHRINRFQYIWFVAINIHTKFGAIRLNSLSIEMHQVFHSMQACDLENWPRFMILGKILKVYPRYISARFEIRSSHSVCKRSNVIVFRQKHHKQS